MTTVHTLEGKGAPVLPPPSKSAHYLDTDTGDQYYAKGAASVGDWVKQARVGDGPRDAVLREVLTDKEDPKKGPGMLPLSPDLDYDPGTVAYALQYILPALGDRLDELPRSVKTWKVYGGLSDERTKLEAAFASGCRNIYFPNNADGRYTVDGPIAVPEGVETYALDRKLSIYQKHNLSPIFDCLNADNVYVHDFHNLIGDYAREYRGGSFRGENTYTYNAAVWVNGSNARIERIGGRNFICIVKLSIWDGLTISDQHFDNVVKSVRGRECDFVVLYSGQDGLNLSDISGRDIVDTSAGINPPHVVYAASKKDGSGNIIRNKNNTISGLRGYNVPAHAFQFKHIDGGSISDLVASDCAELISVQTCNDMAVSNLAGRRMSALDAVYFQADDGPTPSNNLTISGIQLDMSASDRAMVFVLNNSKVSGINHASARTANTDTHEAAIYGSNNDISNVRMFDKNGFSSRAFLVGQGVGGVPTADNTIRDFRLRNKKVWAEIAAGTTNTKLIYSPMDNAWDRTGGSPIEGDISGGVTLGRGEHVIEHTLSGGGSLSSLQRPSLQNATQVRYIITDALAYTMGTILSPNTTPVGTTLKITIANESGGVMGALSWPSSFVFTTAFVAPDNGKAVSYTFRYKGGNVMVEE